MPTQDLYHRNLLIGYSLYEHATSDPIHVPYSNGSPLTITPPTGYTLTEERPSGKWHNGAYTSWKPNANNDPELIYRAELDDTITRHNSDGIAVSEFMNNQDLAKSKDYIVYDKNITAEQADLVDAAIKYSWDASELKSNVARTLVSEWDVSDSNAIFEDTGVINLRDRLDKTYTDIGGGIFTNNSLFTTFTNASVNSFNGIVASGGAAATLSPYNFIDGATVRTRGILKITSITGTVTLKMSNDSLGVGVRSTEIIFSEIGEFIIDDYILINTNDTAIYPSVVCSDEANIEVSNLTFEIHNGNDFTQYLASAQPLLSGTGKTSLVEFDGIQQYLSQPVTPANFQDLTYFEWWGVIEANSTSQVMAMFNANGSNNDYLDMQILATNVIRIIQQNVATNVLTVPSVVDGKYIVAFIATGTEFKIIINGVEQVITGTNNGKFIGDYTNKVNVDTLSIAAELLASSNYYATKKRYGLAIGGLSTAAATTTAERTNIFNMINKRFDLGL